MKRLKIYKYTVFRFIKLFLRYDGFRRFGLLWVFDRAKTKMIYKYLCNKSRDWNLQKRGLKTVKRNATAKKHKLISKRGAVCSMCRNIFSSNELTVDHIVQVKDGGSSKLSNLRLLCRKCHDIRHDMNK